MIRDSDMKKILSMIDRNPLFSAKENAVYFLPENRPVSKLPPKAKEYTTQILPCMLNAGECDISSFALEWSNTVLPVSSLTAIGSAL